MAILGISAFYHDSAAALTSNDGKILAAAQEERFSRIRHDPSFPSNAIRYCFSESHNCNETIDTVVFYENPIRKFTRVLRAFEGYAHKHEGRLAEALHQWNETKLTIPQTIATELDRIEAADWQSKLRFVEHHGSHAASAFFPSPFDKAAIVTLDGVGEDTTTSISHGSGNEITQLATISFPHSLGLLYSAFTYYTGFKINSGEYKLMGLAPFGTPKYESIILDKLISFSSDGAFLLNLDYFDGFIGRFPINEAFCSLFGQPVRKSEEPLRQFHADIAASIQAVINRAVERICIHASQLAESLDVCLAGGVALNCVANGYVQRTHPELNFWIQPAAGDAGGALGAALFHAASKGTLKRSAGIDGMQHSLLGPAFDTHSIRESLDSEGAEYEELDPSTLIENCATLLSEGKTLAWFQGRMEFGPRALGSRSILADPRSETMQRRVNLQVKKRESFRPFAPAVLEEDCNEFFDLANPSPYMLMTAPVKGATITAKSESQSSIRFESPSSPIPAVTHVDGSARIQTVGKEANPVFRNLLEKFKEKTGCPLLLNTSFNVRGEPIVYTPEDAFRCFISTDLDYLAIGNFLLNKEEQDPLASLKIQHHFDPD